MRFNISAHYKHGQQASIIMLRYKGKNALREMQTLHAGCSKQTHKPTHPQSGPITIHCAIKLSAQCNYIKLQLSLLLVYGPSTVKDTGTGFIMVECVGELRRTWRHQTRLVEVETIVFSYVGVAILRPVRQAMLCSILVPSTVIRLVRQESLTDLLLQLAQVTPASIILAACAHTLIVIHFLHLLVPADVPQRKSLDIARTHYSSRAAVVCEERRTRNFAI